MERQKKLFSIFAKGKAGKRILVSALLLFCFCVCAIIYLNAVFFPTKIKYLIIQTLRQQTQKQVDLGSVRFSIFKGIVLRDLSIFDKDKRFLSVKECTASFLIFPVLHKTLVIPTIKIKSPTLYLNRRPDGSLDVWDFFAKRQPQHGANRQGFGIWIHRISIVDGTVAFKDLSLTKAFTAQLKNLSLNVWLNLPHSLKFTLSSMVPGASDVKFEALGEFVFDSKELNAKAKILNLSPQEFSSYYENLGIKASGGILDTQINVNLKDEVLKIELSSQDKNLTLAKDKTSAELNLDIQTSLTYNIKNKNLSYLGKAMISDSRIFGIPVVEKISSLRGELNFSHAGIYANNLACAVWGLPVKVRASLSSFNSPLVKIQMSSGLDMVTVAELLKDKFHFNIPAKMEGKADLNFSLQAKSSPGGYFNFNGLLNITKAKVKFQKLPDLLEGLSGKINFDKDGLGWEEFAFQYSGETYRSEGRLNNFQSPQIHLSLKSQKLNLEADADIQNKLIRVAKLSGNYLNSTFDGRGDIDISEQKNLLLRAWTKIDMDLADSKALPKRFQESLKKINPQGRILAQFNFDGNPNNLKSCAITATLKGNNLSFFGLKVDELQLDGSQQDGIVDIALLRLLLYEGSLEASAKLNLNSENLPYWLMFDVNNVKIERLKVDTALKKNDIAGSIFTSGKINGFCNEPKLISATGKIMISEGKLWELNLFQGLGKLIFAKEFANIIFHEGHCAFSIKDEMISTDNLVLKSNITNLSGPVNLGFNGAISASLNIEVIDRMVPLTGTFKDIATAIVGNAGIFGTIEISGTVNDPKYKFTPAVVEIFKSIKETILSQ